MISGANAIALSFSLSSREKMMQESLFYLGTAAASLAGLAIVAATGLRGWNGWLTLKHAELAQAGGKATPPSASARIEVADLRERIRKLEAIAAGVDI